MIASSSRTQIRFWSDPTEPGAPVLLIQYGTSRLIVNFGASRRALHAFYDGTVRPRPHALVRDYLQLGVLPPIDGLYAGNHLPIPSSLAAAGEIPSDTVVILADPDPDNLTLSALISPDIPVYVPPQGLRLHSALSGLREAGQPRRPYLPLATDDPLTVGELRVTALPLDAELTGACALHIATPDGSLLYARHLPSNAAISALTPLGLGAQLLLTEGARSEAAAQAPKPISRLAQELLTLEGLAVFGVDTGALESIHDWVQAAEQSGRMAVLEPESAHLLAALTEKRDFLVFESEERMKQYELDTTPPWLRQLYGRFHFIPAGQINRYKQAYAVQNSPSHLLELLDYDLAGGLYYHDGGGAALAEGASPSRVRSVLERLGVHQAELPGETRPADALRQAQQLQAEHVLLLGGRTAPSGESAQAGWQTADARLVYTLTSGQFASRPLTEKERIGL